MILLNSRERIERYLEYVTGKRVLLYPIRLLSLGLDISDNTFFLYKDISRKNITVDIVTVSRLIGMPYSITTIKTLVLSKSILGEF